MIGNMRAFRIRLAATAAVLLIAAWALAERLEDTFFIPLDHPAIQYSQRPANDPVALLDKRLRRGQVNLGVAPNGLAYLPAVLKELGINARLPGAGVFENQYSKRKDKPPNAACHLFQ